MDEITRTMPPVQCQNCGLIVQVPEGGRRLCGCGTWLSADEVPVVVEAAPEETGERWPRIDADLAAFGRLTDGYRRIRKELHKAVVGQHKVLEELLIAIFARGHCLLVGVPGLAKTLMIRTLADSLNLSFSRIQFTPDLMPSDIIGTEVLQEDKATGQRMFKFLHGPLFANVILADEVNRTPPKTQAALLEAMQERQVTVGGVDHALPDPFFVLATQNPIEQEGTYPLPEAQLDRFMFMILVDYPTAEEELQIMKTATGIGGGKPAVVLTEQEILNLQHVVRRMPVAEHVYSYAEKLVRVTRPASPEALDFCKKWLTWGAGPRAGLNLIMAAKARAMLHGQYYVSCEDVAAMALPIFRHRMIPNFAAQSESVTPDDITRKILETVPKDEKLK